MMDHPLNAYFDWLYSQILIENGRRTSKTYVQLVKKLHETPFVWIVANDDNRIGDALETRIRWMAEHGVAPELFQDYPCSVLEVIISLSQRLAFMMENTTAPGWAWELLTNLQLHKYGDPLLASEEDQVVDILESLIWRRYETNGQGGLFPLAWSTDDQTQVELWYQMSSYVEEKQLP